MVSSYPRTVETLLVSDVFAGENYIDDMPSLDRLSPGRDLVMLGTGAKDGILISPSNC